MDAAFLHQLTGILVPIGICVVLPVLCVWLVMRAKINKDNANKEVLIAAINKNSELEIACSYFCRAQFCIAGPPPSSILAVLLQSLL